MDDSPSLLNRLRFREDDPMRYLHVPPGERLDDDEGDFSDAREEFSGDVDDNFDWAAVRARGDVVPPEDLQ